jgi:hypothetical protein
LRSAAAAIESIYRPTAWGDLRILKTHVGRRRIAQSCRRTRSSCSSTSSPPDS